ncbi:MAG: type II secretion system protein N [Proteobacteria bacterium]|nr:type II secretion system protein N [Pseudomonadota bacterium]
MARHSRLISLGLLTFLAAVVLFFPARVAYQWFVPPDLQLSGIRGSIWHGSASEASARGIYLRELQWRIQPLSLLTAKLAYSVQSRFASGFLEADIATSISGAVNVSDLSASLPLTELQSVLGLPGLRGNLSVQFSRLRVVDGLPIAADGNVSIAQLAVPFIYRDAMGDFKAEFFTEESAEDATIVASFEDGDALFDLAGSLQLSSDRSYRLLGQLAVTENTPATLQQYFSAGLGAADARGQHEFRLEGIL